MKKISYIMFALLGMGTMAEAQTLNKPLWMEFPLTDSKWNVMAGTWS